MKTIYVDEEYQQGYSYILTEPEGKHFDPAFKPQLTPKQMLQLGIFGGNYFTKAPHEFPADWFEGVQFTKTGHADASLNYFGVNASRAVAEHCYIGRMTPESCSQVRHKKSQQVLGSAKGAREWKHGSGAASAEVQLAPPALLVVDEMIRR